MLARALVLPRHCSGRRIDPESADLGIAGRRVAGDADHDGGCELVLVSQHLGISRNLNDRIGPYPNEISLIFAVR